MTGLGTVEVSGRSRVPSPPTRMTACTRPLSRAGAGRGRLDACARDGGGLGDLARATTPDPLVAQAGAAHLRGLERVAPVDQQVPAHRVGDLAPVEVAELLPLGDQHDG